MEFTPRHLLLLVFAAAVIGFVLVLFYSLFIRRYRKTANALGYASLGEYLRAAPRNDEERRLAVDMALSGGLICLFGLLIPPLIIFGAYPLYHGARKMAYASMGLGLVDDGRG